jgi:lysophospholipase L1-like esterase
MPPRALKQIERIAAATEPILVVGDSIAERWPAESRLDTFGQPSFDFGISGNRTSDVLSRLTQADLSRTQFATALIIVGTNDLVEKSPGQIYDGIMAIVELLQRRTKAAVNVLSILPRGQRAMLKRVEIMEVNRRLRDGQAAGRYVYVDAWAPFDAACTGVELCALLSGRLHPNDAGYRVLGDSVRTALKAR